MGGAYARAMKDFSRVRTEKKFRIDPDVFEASPAIPAQTLAELANRFSDIDNTPAAERFNILSEALELVLFPESYELLKARMQDKKNPVELEQLSDIIVWLLGEYGMRPTEPSSVSSDGPPMPESGTNLTGSFLPGESISTLSPPIAS